VGGLVGAGVAKAGLTAIVWSGLGTIGSAIVLSPLTGLVLAMMLVLAVSWLAVRSTPFAMDRRFRVLQFVSSSLLSLAHGGNDAQKTMGIITVLLYSQGLLTGDFHVPLWVVLSCQSAMALGTLCGGCRIVRTVGSRITHLTPMHSARSFIYGHFRPRLHRLSAPPIA
jgi:PiT family inorganic phosphate transporter